MMWSFIFSLCITLSLTLTFAKAVLDIVYSLVSVRSASIAVSAFILGFVLTIKFLRFIFRKGGE